MTVCSVLLFLASSDSLLLDTLENQFKYLGINIGRAAITRYSSVELFKSGLWCNLEAFVLSTS